MLVSAGIIIPKSTQEETEAQANVRAAGGDRVEKDSMTGQGEAKTAAALCPKAIPVGDKITVSNRFLARAPPQPQQPPGTRNALVSMVSFTGQLCPTQAGKPTCLAQDHSASK